MSQPAESSPNAQHVPEAESGAVPARRTRALATAMLILAIAVIALRLAEFVARVFQRVSLARIIALDPTDETLLRWATTLDVSALTGRLLETTGILVSIALTVVAILLAIRVAGRARTGAVLVAVALPVATAVLALYRLLQDSLNDAFDRVSDPAGNTISEPLAYLGLGLVGLVTAAVAVALIAGTLMARRSLAAVPHEAGSAAGAATPRALGAAGLILAAATIVLWFADLGARIMPRAVVSLLQPSDLGAWGPLFDVVLMIRPFLEAASILSAAALTVVAILLAIRTAGRGRVGAIIVALTYPVVTALLAVHVLLASVVERTLEYDDDLYDRLPVVELVAQGLVIVAASAAIAVGTLMTRRWIARR